MREIKMEGVWQGWEYSPDEAVLFDSGGNHYYMDEIRAIFMFRQWMSGEIGNSNEIKFMKSELRKKIDSVKMPKVTIDWGEVQETVVHPWARR
ncbi:MAG: hypothetical protein KTR16_02455 [Acidiferrobacterales bacterium]|nr:hypothetical protein [Acidiferrobacterales bacterium]